MVLIPLSRTRSTTQPPRIEGAVRLGCRHCATQSVIARFESAKSSRAGFRGRSCRRSSVELFRLRSFERNNSSFRGHQFGVGKLGKLFVHQNHIHQRHSSASLSSILAAASSTSFGTSDPRKDVREWIERRASRQLRKEREGEDRPAWSWSTCAISVRPTFAQRSGRAASTSLNISW
jgi:hypothetical protein